ncbi:31819_t:CDS:2, partial [Gigaspora margarita]
LNINTDRIMAFSGHRSLGGIASYQTFTKEIMNDTVAMIIPDSESSSDYSRIPFAPISTSNYQVSCRIHPRISKPRPFKPFDASKPFVSLLKKSAKIVEEDIQEILLAIDSNSVHDTPRIIIENCSNCKIEVKITMK